MKRTLDTPRLAIRLPTERSVIAVLAGLTSFIALLAIFDGRPSDAWPFGLDTENAPGAAFSSLILLTAAALSLYLGLARGRRPIPLIMAGVLAFMAYDEAFMLHEELEARIELDWQMIYAPLIVAFGATWLGMLAEIRVARARLYWLAGALAWFVAQVLEWLQWGRGGDTLVHAWMIVPEEVLEIVGSSAWLLALLVCLRISASEQLNSHRAPHT